jgi:acyl carrier protein
VLSQEEILERLNAIIRDVLQEDELQLTMTTTARDVDGWDSLTHVRLVLTVEKAFGVKLSAAEIGRLKSVGDLVTLLSGRLSGDKRTR